MEFLKETFGTEALTYEQLAEKLKDSKDIKLGNLAGGAYVSKEKFSSLETERDGLKTQLETAATEIKSYKDLDVDGIKQAATDWETKYNTETQTLKDQLAAQGYEFAVQQAVSGVKFSSESAKRAFIADLTEKKLPMQENKLLGLDDFRKEYETSDPGAFITDEGDKTPIATKGGTGGSLSDSKELSMREAIAEKLKG